MKRIILDPSEVWDYYLQSEEILSDISSKLIADNILSGAQIYLCVIEDAPTILACVDNEVIDEETVLNEKDCKETVRRFYGEYLDDSIDGTITSEIYEKTCYEEDDLIDERESEINDAIFSMIGVLLPDICDTDLEIEETCEELADLICEYLYRNHGVSVYRPMYLKCEDGSEEFCEYPYEEMEYDED